MDTKKIIGSRQSSAMEKLGQIQNYPNEYQAIVRFSKDKFGNLTQYLADNNFEFLVNDQKGQCVVQVLSGEGEANDLLEENYELMLLEECEQHLYIRLQQDLKNYYHLDLQRVRHGPLGVPLHLHNGIRNLKVEIRKDIQALIALTGQHPPFLSTISFLLENDDPSE